ncbi:MAG: hypothetical protein NTZ15_12580 [Burkholderiales bacterium]|nr:hypothetical protein [Burkholderiales bacterium]
MEEDKKPSRRHRVSKTEPPMPWWLQQLRERPLATAGTVASVMGGLLLLVFFCQLGRIPELDLAGVSAILMAVAVVGFALAAALTGCAFGAGLMMRGQEESPNGLGENRALALLIAPGMLSTIAFALHLYW